MKGGSTFRIKCQDDGFPEKPQPGEEDATSKATVADLQRAKTKVPRGSFRGDDFEHMSKVLNYHLQKSAPSVKECEEWAVEELQQFQVLMMAMRDPNLNGIYRTTNDNRRL